MATINLPFAAAGDRRIPNVDELANGFPCGALDRDLHNWLPWWVTGEIARAMAAAGLTVDDTDLDRLARAIQQGSNYAVATGTANAWVITLPLAPLAYAAGLSLDVVAPATNTSTTVNANVEGLGNRRIKRRDGTDPAIGDLVSGVAYVTVDDGTNIRILTPLPSEIVAVQRQAPFYGLNAPPATNNILSGGSPTTLITTYGTVKNQLGTSSTFTGGILTIGTGDDGFYALNAYVNTNLPRGGSGGTVNPYAVALTIDLSADGGTVWTSVATYQESSGTTLIFGPQPSATVGAIELSVGHKVRVTAGQSSGVTIAFPVNFSAAKLGR